MCRLLSDSGKFRVAHGCAQGSSSHAGNHAGWTGMPIAARDLGDGGATGVLMGTVGRTGFKDGVCWGCFGDSGGAGDAAVQNRLRTGLASAGCLLN